jgi:uncharacterized protein YecT (DUF1311 family)
MRALLSTFCVLFIAASLSEGASDECTIGSNAEITACMFEHYRTADTDLNRVYQEALKSAGHYGPKDVDYLRDAQRKWIAYRDAECEAEYSLFGGGTGGPAARSTCLLRITRRRIEDLKSAYFLDEKSK